jgi:hypothetical protein
MVPDGIWALAVPEALRERVLCLTCFARFADENGVAWDRAITFYPVSLKTHVAFCAAEEGDRGTT